MVLRGCLRKIGWQSERSGVSELFSVLAAKKFFFRKSTCWQLLDGLHGFGLFLDLVRRGSQWRLGSFRSETSRTQAEVRCQTQWRDGHLQFSELVHYLPNSSRTWLVAEQGGDWQEDC